MEWPGSAVINATDTTTQALASCIFQDQLYLFWKSSSSNQIFFSVTSPGAYDFPAGQLINGVDWTPQAPAACVFNNQIFLFWVADNSSNKIFFSASDVVYDFPAGQPLNGTDATPDALAACVFKGQLFLSGGPTPQIRFFSLRPQTALRGLQANSLTARTRLLRLSRLASSTTSFSFFGWPTNLVPIGFGLAPPASGTAWPAGQPINGTDSTPHTPAACVFNNQLFPLLGGERSVQ